AAALASGRYDSLSGLLVSPTDDLDALAADRDVVDRRRLHTLRVRTLRDDAASSSPPLASVLASGERHLGDASSIAPLRLARLVLDGPGCTVVMIGLFDRGSQTEVVLTQDGFDNAAARAAHERGWVRCLDLMAGLGA